MSFGPEYPKIQSLWKRDDRGVVVIGDHSTPEIAYLKACDWSWTEKVDGTNIRIHWNGDSLVVGGRTDRADISTKLIANLNDSGVVSEQTWRQTFPDADDVTVYGEGYGSGIQSGGQYRPDQTVVVFDVLVGGWWLNRAGVADVATKLGLEVVPIVGEFPPNAAWYQITEGMDSAWPGARIEGLVGRPAVDLFGRRGERIMTKVKVKDWLDHQRRGGTVVAAGDSRFGS